jgi:hypothetical protein
MALRIRQAWAQLAGGDPNAARATLAPLAPGSDRERVAHLLAQAAAAWFSGDAAEAGRSAAEAQSLSLEQGLAREARMAVQIQAMVAHSTGDWPAALRRGLDASLLAPDLADTLFDGHLCVAEYALTSGTPLDRVRAAAEELHTDSLRFWGASRTGAGSDVAGRGCAGHRPDQRGRRGDCVRRWDRAARSVLFRLKRWPACGLVRPCVPAARPGT